MADLVLVYAASPEALLADACAPFCVPGRPAGPLPVLAVRQGGVRDEVLDRAARAGCAGWLGAPLLVFAELPALLAGELAPLTAAERRVLVGRVVRRARLRALGAGRGRAREALVRALDALFGDLAAEEVAPADAAARLARAGAGRADAWADARDADVAALYDDYLAAVRALPPDPARGGAPRTDGRDGPALAARAVRARPDRVRARLRAPFGPADGARDVTLYGLTDLRRGWGRLVAALAASEAVGALRVHALLDAPGPPGAADEPLAEHALAAALVALGARAEPAADTTPGAPLGTGCGGGHGAAPAPVRLLAAPDARREAELVARRVKALLVGDGAGAPPAPHRVAVVARQARPHAALAAAALVRLGVPVTTRTRLAAAETGAGAAFVRVFACAAAGFAPEALGDVAASPYFAHGLDAGLLAEAARRAGLPPGRPAPLAAWSAAVAAVVGPDDDPASGGAGRADGAPDADFAADLDAHLGAAGAGEARVPAARARALLATFDAVHADAERLVGPHPRAGWVALARAALGGAAGAAVPPAPAVPAGAPPGGWGPDGLWELGRLGRRAPADLEDPLAVDAVRADAAALDVLAALLADWQGALALDPAAADEPLGADAWHAELAAAVAEAEVALPTPHRRGVQVLEASAAAGRTFEHVFVVGMEAGSFPAEPDPAGLYAPHERQALADAGLPVDPPAVWAAREASLWRGLVRGARRGLHASHAYADARGRAVLPAAAFEALADERAAALGAAGALGAPGAPDAPDPVERVPGSAVACAALADAWCPADLLLAAGPLWRAGDRAAAALAHAHLLAPSPAGAGQGALVGRVLAAAGAARARDLARAAEPRRPHPHNGRVASPDLLAALGRRYGDRVWSATELERYGRCPFHFFARDVLGARPLGAAEEPDDGVGGARRGALLHRCLELLLRDLHTALGDAALTGAARPRARRRLPQVVAEVLDGLAAEGAPLPPVVRAVEARALAGELAAYLEWEIGQNEAEKRRATPRREPVAFEVAFGLGGLPPVTLQRGGRTLRLRGRIDRVDEVLGVPGGGAYVVDYKTSRASLTPVGQYEEGGILQLPLYLLALGRLAKDEGRVWGGAYQVTRGTFGRPGALHPSTLTADGKVRRGSTKGEREDAARLDAALDHALAHVDGVAGGAFPARVQACVPACPGHCDYRAACREYRPARGGDA